jgi:integrase
MPIVNLTTAFVDGLRRKPPASGRLEVWDEKTPGLCLRISATGAGAWSFRYRPRAGTGYQRITLGTLKNLGLADARERAARYRVDVHDGADPQRERTTKRAAAANILTFERLAERYLAEYAKPRKASWRNDEIYLKRPRERWGDRDARAISRQDAIALLDDIKRTAPVSANRTQSILVTLFNWAVEDELVEANPLARLKKRAVEQAKDRTLSDPELRCLWQAVENSGLSAGTVAAFQVLALLGQRPGEVVGMRRSELVSLEKPGVARWEIPAERTKARRAHVVPLPERARQIIAREAAQSDRIGDFVFASKWAHKDRLARHSLSQALRRVIAGLIADDSNAATVNQLRAKPATPHDLRRTCATKLAEIGIPREDRLAVLAHVQGDVHGAHYDRYERLKEKRLALDAWGRHVATVLGEEAQTAQVGPITRSRA